MEGISDLPQLLKEIHQSLKHFVNQAQDIAQIRRVLALYLSAHVKGEPPISHPLSLLGYQCNIGSASSGIRGIRREYLRCVRANINAREEYERLRSEHNPHFNQQSQDQKDRSRKGEHGSGTSLELFLEVVKYQREHERLRILEDYVVMLAQKPAAAPDRMDPGVVLKGVDSLPPVPSDVMISTGQRQESQRTDLNNLVNQLEKSVLRAKLLLKREQKLLSKVKAEGASCSTSATSAGSRLQALGTARNELINWIETELATAGESSGASSDQDFKLVKKEGKEHIDSQLSSTQRKYAQYTKARQALLIAASGSPEPPAPTATGDNKEELTSREESEKTTSISHVLHPYLEELTSVSNRQKSIIQQKSHLTISLAKQLKEAGQGLDRLAEESHLLLSYPLGASQHKALEASFGDGISNLEKPDSSRRARAWVHASGLASKATKAAVAEKLEEGEGALLDVHQTLLDLQSLLGEDLNAGGDSNLTDAWALLDGHLGVIERHGIDEL